MKRALLVLAACGTPPPTYAVVDAPPIVERFAGTQSSTIATDGTAIYVVNPDSDSISIVDVLTEVATEVLLAPARPSLTAAGDYAPAVMPRALVLAHGTLFVTGQRAGKLFAIDLATHAVRSVAVGSEPIGAIAVGDTLYVACSQDASVVVVDAASLTVTARIVVGAEPWSLATAADGSVIVTHLLGPGLTAIDPGTHATRSFAIPDIAPRGDRRLAHGQVRGIYAVAGHGDELWAVHQLLGTDTAQPDLDFESTAFPAVTRLGTDGTVRATLSIDAQDIPGVDGAFADIVSAPRAIAFAGERALIVDGSSEDVLVIDAATGVETALIRPLPGHGAEGIAIDGQIAYLDERNSGDIARIDLKTLAVTGTIRRLAIDPMPAQLRLGQHLFYSANSDEYPISTNHWVACASCHLEGRSDAVTWRFAQGPRDTPSNAGGMLGTGFLFRTAARTRVQDYWHTINVEQGGAFAPTTQAALLDALEAYVDHALPLPIPPTTDPVLVARGKIIFERSDIGCASCHAGPRFTDSGAGNPALDLAGPVVLHDVGTCVTTGFPDTAQPDLAGHPRAACMFDTPSLSGVASSPPYLHDGRAATLRDALEMTRGTMGDITNLSSADLDALVEYLRSL